MSERFDDLVAARDAMRKAYAEYHRCDNTKQSDALNASLRKIRLAVIEVERALRAHGLTSCFGSLPVEEVWPEPLTERTQ